ncbi:hypothetical protein [Marinobacterium stanieri]|uniref:Uncharacterized protein n=1 Tax=Marinobacterium stanieri TaxID=49186 RepID=A0A1N6XGG1_9GAMM|nr:hypothetical protein [Marinobacterium stanieri]SIR01415.1 hypothetical protein SAMN05421647_11414 [Marinobacterium stanieri]
MNAPNRLPLDELSSNRYSLVPVEDCHGNTGRSVMICKDGIPVAGPFPAQGEGATVMCPHLVVRDGRTELFDVANDSPIDEHAVALMTMFQSAGMAPK